MNAVAGASRYGTGATATRVAAIDLLPAAAAIAYPFLLDAFHATIGPAGAARSFGATAAAALLLAAAFAVPALGIACAWHAGARKPALRRLAYLTVAAPTLYVFLGVVNAMAHSAYPDELLWAILWIGIAAWAVLGRSRAAPGTTAPDVARGRVAHGVVAATVMLYVLYHLATHLALLGGAGAAMSVMHAGEAVYRARAVELLLVLAMLFMCASGGYLAWRWSAKDSRRDFFRTFQIASGVFLMMYIVGHMDSVFIYARLFLGIPTDWKFATGAPAGMLHDAWNIRLLPHYALGAFFVLAHPVTGARNILLAHRVAPRIANIAWGTGIGAAAAIAAAIIVGMCRVAPG